MVVWGEWINILGGWGVGGDEWGSVGVDGGDWGWVHCLIMPILNTKININQKLHRLEYHHGHFLEKQTLQIPGKIQPRNPEVYR